MCISSIIMYSDMQKPQQSCVDSQASTTKVPSTKAGSKRASQSIPETGRVGLVSSIAAATTTGDMSPFSITTESRNSTGASSDSNINITHGLQIQMEEPHSQGTSGISNGHSAQLPTTEDFVISMRLKGCRVSHPTTLLLPCV